MQREVRTGFFIRLVRWAVAGLVLCAAGATIARAPQPADASQPSAVSLADKALYSPTMLADESPYELIDPVGPGGISSDQAKTEVTSSTMIGGLMGDGTKPFSGGY
jgi:hypothetical protein